MHTPRLITSSSQRRLTGASADCLTESPLSPLSTLKREFVAIICPFNSGPGRGNITTVRRIAEHLPASGCRVTTVALDSMRTDDHLALLNQSAPDLLHAFHAYHAGPITRSIAHTLGVPYLLTITGSDLFEKAMCNAPATRQALADASAVTCFDALVAQRLTEVFPALSDKLFVIPQGVEPLAVIEPFPRAANEFLILMSAPLRPVKGITSAIEALAPLAAEFQSLRLLLAGGPIDPEYAADIQAISARLPWVRLLGDVPHQQMGALYAAADLVLNSSFFE
ncbi:MAG: glycosyltransferase family 4 protein, partial [Steroidobacteraceae bacterium]|nr:glycosyltransferase family 4 protein [Deltaproteobacteria bacterium]